MNPVPGSLALPSRDCGAVAQQDVEGSRKTILTNLHKHWEGVLQHDLSADGST